MHQDLLVQTDQQVLQDQQAQIGQLAQLDRQVLIDLQAPKSGLVIHKEKEVEMDDYLALI